tara:strand:+ start:4208 stop:5791 length:1584 start_codon:yes stop_codon:yes gene_type:complete
MEYSCLNGNRTCALLASQLIVNDHLFMSKSSYPRNMEPPEGQYSFVFDLKQNPLQMIYNFILKHTENFNIICFEFVRKKEMLRLRGGVGGTNPNVDDKFNEIPYLTSNKFMWNGLPCFDFVEKIKNVLDNGLGSINIKDGTLLMTVRMIDPGGVNGVPMRAVAPANTIEDSIMRNVKSFSCIMNYMDPKCELFKSFMRDFQTDGISIYNVICAIGPLPTPPRILRAREDSWTRMTMDTLRMNYTIESYIQWNEIVCAQARVLGKNGNQMKEKLISGLPDFFNAERTAMSHSVGVFVFPAVYGAMPGYAGSPLAALAHPLAGQPDTTSMIRAFVADWIDKSSSMPKGTPEGLVRSIEESVFEEQINLLSSDIKSTTKCFVCGGDGHAATQEMPDGEKLICPTKVLRTGVSNGAREYTKPSHSSTSTARAHKTMSEKIEQLEQELEHTALRLQQSGAREQRRRPFVPRSKTASQAESDIDNASADSAFNEEEDGSDDSAASQIHQFAEVLNKSDRRPYSGTMRKGNGRK